MTFPTSYANYSLLACDEEYAHEMAALGGVETATNSKGELSGPGPVTDVACPDPRRCAFCLWGGACPPGACSLPSHVLRGAAVSAGPLGAQRVQRSVACCRSPAKRRPGVCPPPCAVQTVPMPLRCTGVHQELPHSSLLQVRTTPWCLLP
jgi:hypothetical protein